MARVKCIMMQKNETRLLAPWARFYGYMFGYENLIIIDNGSEQDIVHPILNKLEQVGVKVLREHISGQDFLDKGTIISNIIKKLDRTESYDIALPLDCDEFLVSIRDGKLSARRDRLHEELDSLEGSRKTMILTQNLGNVPGMAGWFTCGHLPKAVFRSNTISQLDNGFHHPHTVFPDQPIVLQSLAHVHLHNRRFDELRKFSLQKLRNYIDVNDLERLINYRGNCEHLVPYLTKSEATWRAGFESQPMIAFPGILFLFEALGIDIAETLHEKVALPQDACKIAIKLPSGQMIDFDPGAYIAQRPDVEDAALSALYHFCHYGHKEA